MKRIAAIFAAVLALVSCAEGPKVLRAEKNGDFNLGRIKEIDGPVTFTGIWKNDTGRELTVKTGRVACASCSQVKITDRNVRPGDELTLEITYNPAYRKGLQREAVSIIFTDGTFENFYIVGDVVPYNHPIEEDHRYDYGEGLRMSHKVLPFGKKAAGEKGYMYFRVGNANTGKAKIEFRTDSPYASSAVFRQNMKMKGDQRDTVHVNFTMPEGFSEGDTLKIVYQPYVNGVPTEQTLLLKAYGK